MKCVHGSIGLVGLMCTLSLIAQSTHLTRRRMLAEDQAEQSGVKTARTDMKVVLLACDRESELNESLHSLTLARVQDIVVSLDCPSHGVVRVVEHWRRHFRSVDMRSSHQRWHREVGEQKRKTDERVARHWIDAVASTFQGNPDVNFVIYMEEDHIVAPGFWDAAEWIVTHGEVLCPSYFSYNLGCHGDCWGQRTTEATAVIRMESGNMGVVYKRTAFQHFLDQSSTFCSMLGNWDINVHIMQKMRLIGEHSLTLLNSQITHLPTCKSSRNGATHSCTWAAARRILFKARFDPRLMPSDRGMAPNIHAPNPVRADDETIARCRSAIYGPNTTSNLYAAPTVFLSQMNA